MLGGVAHGGDVPPGKFLISDVLRSLLEPTKYATEEYSIPFLSGTASTQSQCADWEQKKLLHRGARARRDSYTLIRILAMSGRG